MKKLLSVLLAMLMLVSMFSVNTMAADDEWDTEWDDEWLDFEFDYTLDDVITLFEDSVFISMAGGEIVDSISVLSYEDGELVSENDDGTVVYSNKDNEFDEFGQKPLYSALSVVRKMDIGYRISEFYFDDFSYDGYVVFIFLLKDSNDNAIWYKVATDWDGYILEYSLSTDKTVDGIVCKTEETHTFEYTENIVYIDNSILNLRFAEMGEITLTMSPNAEYYITVTGENPEAVELYDWWGFIEIVGRREGSAEVNIVDYDTDEIIKTIYVNVEFTVWDWIVYIVFFGWAWL